MTGIERFLLTRNADDKDLTRYYMKCDDIKYLWSIADTDESKALLYAFYYGFEKGRRCERAKHKKAANAPTDQSEALTATDTTVTGCHDHCTTAADGKQEEVQK